MLPVHSFRHFGHHPLLLPPPPPLLLLLLCYSEFRLLSVVVNQDRFLFIALATLLNLAEEASVQRKMVKKDVVGLLLGMLTRPHLEVLLLVVSFMRRLCVYVVSWAGWG
jgi:hypothetical protein